MKKYLLLIALLMASCGESKINVDDSNHNVSGEAYQYIIVQFEFITKVKKLCNELHLQSDYSSKELYKQAVAQCTFDNLSLLDIGAVAEFTNGFCDNQDAYNELTPTEQAQVDQLCEVL